MASHYLIDYENVREAGVNYCHRAVEGDVVYLIYTSNASKIGLDALAGMSASVKVIKVAAGKQSLDMHLISMLGYLVHKYGREDRYTVVSKDTGYDSVLRYWTAEGYKAERITGVKEAQTKKAATGKEQPMRLSDVAERPPVDASLNSAQAGDDASKEIAQEEADIAVTPKNGRSRSRRSRRSKSLSGNKPTEQNAVLAGSTEAAAGDASADDASELPETDTETTVSAAAEDNTSAKEQLIKEQSAKTKTKSKVKDKKPEQPTEQGEKQIQPTPGELRKRLNGRLLSILSKEKVDIKTAGQIASLAVKNADVKNSKQLIYRSLLQKFGQKQGLVYYGLIKAEL